MLKSISDSRELPPAGWDELVSRLGGSIYHSAAWAEYVRAASGQVPCYLKGLDPEGGVLAAAVGMLSSSSRPVASRLFRTLSFQAHPAVVSGDAGLAVEFLLKCEQYALGRGCYEITLESFMSGHSPIMAAGEGYRWTDRVEFFVDLTRDVESIWQDVHQDQKERVRRLRRKGLLVEIGEKEEDLLMLKNCREATQSKRASQGMGYELSTEDEYYRRLFRMLVGKGAARLLVAKNNGIGVAALFFTTFNRRACSMLSGSTEEGYKLGAQSLLFWSAVEMFKAEGYTELNRGGVPAAASDPGHPLHGIYSFKSRLGTTPLTCRSASKTLKPGRARMHSWMQSVASRTP